MRAQRPKPEHSAHAWIGSAGAGLSTGVFDCALLRHQLRHTGEAKLRMIGNSMSPLLPMGSMVKLRPVRPGENLQGAIAAVDWGNNVVVHRVVEAEGATVVTQGLHASKPDHAISRESVIGVVCQRDRWPIRELQLRTAAYALAMSLRSLRALRDRW